MSCYYKLDANGCLAYSLQGGDIPEDAVFVDFDIGNQPSEYHRFNYSTRQWIDIYSQTQKILIESSLVLGKRKDLLSFSDWTQLPDVPLETKQAWATYRQALRDITTQEGYPFNVIWPTKPE